MTAISIAYCHNSQPIIGIVFAPFLGIYGTLYSAIRGLGAWMSEGPWSSLDYPPSSSLPPPEQSVVSEQMIQGQGALGVVHDYTPMRLPWINPPPPLPPHAPAGCLYLSEWGKDRRKPTLGPDGEVVNKGNLARKRDSFYRVAVVGGGMDEDALKAYGVSEGETVKGVHGVRSLGSATMDMVYVAAGQADIMYEGASVWLSVFSSFLFCFSRIASFDHHRFHRVLDIGSFSLYRSIWCDFISFSQNNSLAFAYTVNSHRHIPIPAHNYCRIPQYSGFAVKRHKSRTFSRSL